LGALADVELDPPATIVIGQVAGLDLAWYERKPLFGVRVVVTRAREQASDLSRRLRDLGAFTVELPAIEIGPPADGGVALADAAARVGEYDWVVFTSANAVERFLPLVADARRFGAARIAAIGPGTAAALAARSLIADLVPSEFVAEAVLDVFPGGPGRVLLPRAAVARDVLPDGLRAKRWEVDVVDAYRTQPVTPSAEALEAAATAQAITFTSSSTVTNDLASGAPVPPLVACIGPVTAGTARAAGLVVDVVADPHTIEGLVEALR